MTFAVKYSKINITIAIIIATIIPPLPTVKSALSVADWHIMLKAHRKTNIFLAVTVTALKSILIVMVISLKTVGYTMFMMQE